MARRLTWKGHVTSDQAWTLRTAPITTAEIAALVDGDFKPTGPFDAHQLTEFLYRARYLAVDGDITTTGAPETIDCSLYHCVGGFTNPETVDEIALAIGYSDLFAGSLFEVGYTAGNILQICSISPADPAHPIPVYVDENGAFWMFLLWVLTNGSTLAQSGVASDAYIVGNLVLESGTIDVPLGVIGATSTATGGTVTITATEWWPFQHAEPQPSPFVNTYSGEYLPPFTPAALDFSKVNNSNIIAAL